MEAEQVPDPDPDPRMLSRQKGAKGPAGGADSTGRGARGTGDKALGQFLPQD